MKPDSSKLRQQQQQATQTEALHLTGEAQAGQQQFDSAEEMIRFDAAQTRVPERLEERLRQSVAQEPPPARSWWKRLFGRR